jgi:hypothetical protein
VMSENAVRASKHLLVTEAQNSGSFKLRQHEYCISSDVELSSMIRCAQIPSWFVYSRCNVSRAPRHTTRPYNALNQNHALEITQVSCYGRHRRRERCMNTNSDLFVPVLASMCTAHIIHPEKILSRN